MSRDSWAEWREDLAALLAVVGRTEKRAYMERRGIRGDGTFLSERIAIDFVRRAELIERTCVMELLPYSEDDVSHRWTRERCSSCGSIFESDNFEAHGFGNFDFKFCPSCGAKVVDE